MSEAIIIYWYLTIGEVIQTITITSLVYSLGMGVVLLFVAMFINDSRYDKDDPTAGEVVKKIADRFKVKAAVITFFVIVFVGAFYPSEKDIKYIIGGTAVWKTAEYLADNEEAKKIPDNVLKAMNSFLEQVNEEPTN